jgi:hypothetical protein
LVVTVRRHAAVPVQDPFDHPAKKEPVAGRAVRVTLVPLGNEPVHVLPLVVPLQVRPAGLLLTEPLPLPTIGTLIVTFTSAVNVAVTDLFPSMVKRQVADPLQFPLHPVKVKPLAACAVNSTWVPWG